MILITRCFKRRKKKEFQFDPQLLTPRRKRNYECTMSGTYFVNNFFMIDKISSAGGSEIDTEICSNRKGSFLFSLRYQYRISAPILIVSTTKMSMAEWLRHHLITSKIMGSVQLLNELWYPPLWILSAIDSTDEFLHISWIMNIKNYIGIEIILGWEEALE